MFKCDPQSGFFFYVQFSFVRYSVYMYIIFRVINASSQATVTDSAQLPPGRGSYILDVVCDDVMNVSPE